MPKPRSLLSRILRALSLLLVTGIAIALLAIWKVGAWNLVFPSRHHDSVAPALPADLATPAVLVFSKTNSFRHHEGIDGGLAALQAMSGEQGLGMFATENGAVFNEGDLARFDAVVFLNVSGDVLGEAQEQAFQDWLQAGGGWLGIHAAGDSSHLAWQWYMDNLIGAVFTAHIMGPQFQTATVVLENRHHPVLRGLPDRWEHEEEWYSWDRSPREAGFTVLATLDEDSYDPVMRFMGREQDLRMGDHPVVWSNCVGEGRSVYVAMGHKAEAFDQPQVRQLLENALLWLVAPVDDICAPALPDAS